MEEAVVACINMFRISHHKCISGVVYITLINCLWYMVSVENRLFNMQS